MADKRQVSEVQSGKDAEAALGGADNVDKTTYTSPRGADHGGDTQGSARGPTARVSSGGGLGAIAWVVGGLALLAFGLYAAGAF